MTDGTFVRSLFDLPERIHKGDFVLKLTEGIEHPEETAGTFVVTEALADAFDRSLQLVGSALRDGRSMAAYLHGSFGSGKSHFMAVLSLLLDGHEAAWRLAELHQLRGKHEFIGQKKLLQLHFHMIGAQSLEAAIFSNYVEFVQKRHPEASVPGLFADEQLFDDARLLLEQFGEEKFFAAMGGAKKGWGKLAAGWNRERFDQAAASTDPREREKLFSALVKSWFKAYATQSQAYVDIDSGLAVMARHAAELGYDGVVLFLDELILWLSHRASEAAWLHNETQKMVKLVEAEQTVRDVPIVSFIARQRNLAEMVGRVHTGAELVRLHDSLDHWEGRYDTITLEDRNLPAIVERRVLRPRSDEAKQSLDQAFDGMRRAAGSSWQTLLGQQDAEAFRKLYPFSPALVDALVALSNSLQRERTAIKLLMELLVEHMGDLTVGEVVRVGDLFDVLASGEEPADGVMRSRFNSAKQLYKYQFLPLVQESNATNTADRCQRMRDGHPTRLGCSGCSEKQCRTDNRLVKTLLIAALVPEVPVLKDMTAARLYQLNHGTLKVLISGTESNLVAQRLRQWAAGIAQLHVGQEKDPAVRVRLEGVDLKPILDRYSREDTPGARQRVLRELLFGAMGLDKVTDTGSEWTLRDWRGTRRKGYILFGNVRTMSPDALRCRDDHDFRLIVDYPFDEAGKGPHDDQQAIEKFMEETGSWTLVWLPHFFSQSVNQLLGEYVVLEYILSSRDIERQAVSHLSVDNQNRAITDLENLHAQKQARLEDVMAQAYGLKQVNEADIDGSSQVDQHLYVLTAGAHIPVSVAPNLSGAKEAYLGALLEARWPRHPRFTRPLTPNLVEELIARFTDLLTAENQYLPAEKELRGKMLGTLGELGLVRVTETSVHLVEDRVLQQLEQRRRQLGVERPTVSEVRHWIDEGNKTGLQVDAQDLVVRCYARWSRRTLELNGHAYEPLRGKALASDAVLEQPDLPEAAEWQQALAKAGQCFGIALPGRFLSPENLVKLRDSLNKKLQALAPACAELPVLLVARAEELGLGSEADRLVTARSADELCVALADKAAVEQVRALASYEPKTSGAAMLRHMGSVQAVAAVLGDDLVFGVFGQLGSRSAELSGATEILEQVASALRQDEVNVAVVTRIKALALQGQKLLQPGRTPSAPPRAGKVLHTAMLQATGAGEVTRKLDALVADVKRKVEAAGDDVELTGNITLTKRS